MKKLISKWYLVLVIGFLVFAAAVFTVFGEKSYIAIHDNLDLFIAQLQMLKNTGTFWSHGVDVPFLGGISRDNLPSELSMYTVLFMIFPSYVAYVIGYLLKIVLAIGSCMLLAREWYQKSYEEYKPLLMVVSLAYGILNVFPAFGIPFATVPLVIYLLLKIYRGGSRWWYLALFLYPFVSYFSYFGIFILAYMVVAAIWLSIRDKKISWRMILSVVVLSIGCVVFEYRLFGVMLFSDIETIRSSIVNANYNGMEILKETFSVWSEGMFHAESVHTYLILPVCVIYFFILNAGYLFGKKAEEKKMIFHDVYNLFALVLIFNSAIYGLYNLEAFRKLVETLCPPLTGWQFNRTVFFSPFIWYASFFLVLKRLYDMHKSWGKWIANGLAVLCVLVVVFSNTRYNDLYHTCFNKAYELLKGKETDQLSYEEFYATDLFTMAKKDINYQGEWTVAYGFHPAVLEYNGIATLDGYLGFYSMEYKEKFRKVIAPALDRVEASRIYYDDWGARAYLYSGTDISVVSGTKNLNITDTDIYIDTNALKELDGKYIFSRINISNANEMGLQLTGSYQTKEAAYELYVYEIIEN